MNLKLEDYLRTRFASLMYPAAQAFVLNPFIRRVLFCVPFWILFVVITIYRQELLFDPAKMFQAKISFNNDTFKTLLSADYTGYGFLSLHSLYITLILYLTHNVLILNTLIILPFLIGVVWQALTFGEKILGPFKAPIIVLVLSVALFKQNLYVSASEQAFWMFFFLWALNQIYPPHGHSTRHNVSTIFALALLTLTGADGIIAAFWLLVFDVSNIFVLRKENSYPLSISIIFNKLKPYLWSSLPVLFFILYQQKNGWITVSNNDRVFNDSGRTESIESVFLKICVFAILGSILFYSFRKISVEKLLPNTRLITLLLVIIILSYFLKNTTFSTLNLANYLILNLLCLKLMSDLKIGKIQTMLYVGFFIALILFFFSR
jgi:hypothetical protein